MQVPVLAVIPSQPSETQRRGRRLWWWIAALAAVLLLAAALLAFHWFYMPLDVAWYGLLRRISN